MGLEVLVGLAKLRVYPWRILLKQYAQKVYRYTHGAYCLSNTRKPPWAMGLGYPQADSGVKTRCSSSRYAPRGESRHIPLPGVHRAITCQGKGLGIYHNQVFQVFLEFLRAKGGALAYTITRCVSGFCALGRESWHILEPGEPGVCRAVTHRSGILSIHQNQVWPGLVGAGARLLVYAKTRCAGILVHVRVGLWYIEGMQNWCIQGLRPLGTTIGA